MKREILFRGKRVDNGEWIEGDLMQNYIHHQGFLTIIQGGCVYYKVIPETVGQFSGIFNQMDTKAFEHDVIKIGYFNRRYELKFIDGCFKLYHYEPQMNGMYWGTLERLIDIGYDFEIVGTIHDVKEQPVNEAI